MKLHCDSPKDEYPLTWYEMVAVEGVYEPQHSETYTRIIVFRHWMHDVFSAVMLKESGRTGEAVNPDSLGGIKFRRTNERVCIKILKGE